jgi:Spy/CpxP family protein refolding chaperone
LLAGLSFAENKLAPSTEARTVIEEVKMRSHAIGRIFGFLIAATLAGASLAGAQDHQHPPAGGQQQPDTTMRGMPMPGPAMMLMHRKDLGLSAAQVQRLEALAATQKQAMDRLMPQAMQAMSDLAAAASGEVNVEAARAAHDRLARIHTEMLVANLQALKEARQILTPEQRSRWDAMISQMGGMQRMMGSMMHGSDGTM